jgi:3-hydroxyacyl-CoA dehydrogenase
VAAQTGHHVTIVEINEDAIKKARNGIESSLQRVAKKLYKVITLKVMFIINSCTN